MWVPFSLILYSGKHIVFEPIRLHLLAPSRRTFSFSRRAFSFSDVQRTSVISCIIDDNRWPLSSSCPARSPSINSVNTMNPTSMNSRFPSMNFWIIIPWIKKERKKEKRESIPWIRTRRSASANEPLGSHGPEEGPSRLQRPTRRSRRRAGRASSQPTSRAYNCGCTACTN